jgi:hypothetical protein
VYLIRFDRIVGSLVTGSLLVATMLDGHLACNKGTCYPAGSYQDTLRLSLPSLMADGGAVDAGTSSGVDGGIPTDGGVGCAERVGGCPGDSVADRCSALCTTVAARLYKTLQGSMPATDEVDGGTACECDFGAVSYPAQCLPPGAEF